MRPGGSRVKLAVVQGAVYCCQISVARSQNHSPLRSGTPLTALGASGTCHRGATLTPALCSVNVALSVGPYPATLRGGQIGRGAVPCTSASLPCKHAGAPHARRLAIRPGAPAKHVASRGPPNPASTRQEPQPPAGVFHQKPGQRHRSKTHTHVRDEEPGGHLELLPRSATAVKLPGQGGELGPLPRAPCSKDLDQGGLRGRQASPSFLPSRAGHDGTPQVEGQGRARRAGRPTPQGIAELPDWPDVLHGWLNRPAQTCPGPKCNQATWTPNSKDSSGRVHASSDLLGFRAGRRGGDWQSSQWDRIPLNPRRAHGETTGHYWPDDLPASQVAI